MKGISITSTNSTTSIEDEINSYYSEMEEEYETNLAKALTKQGRCYLDETNYLRYNIYGHGEIKLLFIMGLNATGSHWGFQAKYFGLLDDYQICTFDNRGIGDSSCPSGPYTTALLASDALKLLDHLNWHNQVNLIGVSMGGMVAQLMAIKQADRFSTICLTSTYNSAALVVPTTEDIQLSFKMLSRTRSKMMRPLIKICFPKEWLNNEIKQGLTNFQFLMNTLKKLDHGKPEQYSMGEYWQAVAALFHNIAPYKLKNIKNSSCRPIVFHGTKDKVIRGQYGTILSNILSCPMISFNKSGHMLMIEREKEYNYILRAHIENKPLDYYLNQNEMDFNSNLKLVNGRQDLTMEIKSNEKCNKHSPENSWLNKLFLFKSKNKTDINNIQPQIQISKSESSPLPELKTTTIITSIIKEEEEVDDNTVKHTHIRSKSLFSGNKFVDFFNQYLPNHTHQKV